MSWLAGLIIAIARPIYFLSGVAMVAAVVTWFAVGGALPWWLLGGAIGGWIVSRVLARIAVELIFPTPREMTDEETVELISVCDRCERPNPDAADRAVASGWQLVVDDAAVDPDGAPAVIGVICDRCIAAEDEGPL